MLARRIQVFRAPVNVTGLARRAGILGHVLVTAETADHLDGVPDGMWQAVSALALVLPRGQGLEREFTFYPVDERAFSPCRMRAVLTAPSTWLMARVR